jgi:hypothetical protein
MDTAANTAGRPTPIHFLKSAIPLMEPELPGPESRDFQFELEERKLLLKNAARSEFEDGTLPELEDDAVPLDFDLETGRGVDVDLRNLSLAKKSCCGL